MKLSRLFLLLFLLPITAAAQSTSVTLSGTLVNFSSQVLVEDLSEYQYLRPQSPERIIIPDTAGRFSLTFPLTSPNYFRIGRNILYLCPGDRLSLHINYNNNKLATFSGTGATANAYLNDTPFPKGGSYLEAGKNLLPDPQATFTGILGAARQRREQLNALTGVSAEFIRLELGRIKADVLNSFASVAVYLQIKKMADPARYMETFTALSAPVKKEYGPFIDPSLMKLVVYRDVADDLAHAAPAEPGVATVLDWYKASTLVKKMEAENEKSSLGNLRKSIDSLLTPGYRRAVQEYLATLMRFGKGDLAADFKAMSIDGKPVSLSSLKGKVIYIDLWATWCGPCLAEMPRYEELKAKFKYDPNVVFVSLSIDDDHAVPQWKQNVTGRKASGYQWQIDRNKLRAYNIVGIPRTLLIDRNFRITNMNAPLPSSKSAEEAIRKLLE